MKSYKVTFETAQGTQHTLETMGEDGAQAAGVALVDDLNQTAKKSEYQEVFPIYFTLVSVSDA